MNQTIDTVQIASLQAEIADLRQALEQANDGAQQTRIRLLIASRRSQLSEMKRQARR
jgi:ribosomal protein S15P/S13E